MLTLSPTTCERRTRARAHREKERETATVFEQFSNQEIQLETETDFKALGANWYIYDRVQRCQTGYWIMINMEV